MKIRLKTPLILMLVAVLLASCGNSQTITKAKETTTDGKEITTIIPKFKLVDVPGGSSFSPFDGNRANSFFAGKFKLSQTETSYELWYAVREWAENYGYSFQNKGCEGSNGKEGAKPTVAKLEPVTNVSWQDSIVWLNALSEMKGLSPVYAFENGDIVKASTNSNTDAYTNIVQTKYNGYRLATGQEWEVAAKYIDGKNWTPYDYASGATNESSNQKATAEVAVYNTSQTAIVASKKPNALNLYDISGNVTEWCSDYQLDPYGQEPDTIGKTRTIIGGDYSVSPYFYYDGEYRIYTCFKLTRDPLSGAEDEKETNYHDNKTGFRIAQSVPASHVKTETPKFNLISIPEGTYTISEENGMLSANGGFKIGQTEVTYALWYAVRVWAEDNGYVFQNEGMEGDYGIKGELPTSSKLEPVTNISYRDCIVWLNALSEKQGKQPVYRTPEGKIVKDSSDINAEEVDCAVQTNNSGYRLPISSEWELTARYIDGVNWTPYDYASGAIGSGKEATNEVAVYSTVKIAAVATKKANALGIYDMSGNAKEICYEEGSSYCIIRNGCFNLKDYQYMEVRQYYKDLKSDAWYEFGFRIAE